MEGRITRKVEGFLMMILEQTTQPLFLIHDGERYHTSQRPSIFWRPMASVSRWILCRRIRRTTILCMVVEEDEEASDS